MEEEKALKVFSTIPVPQAVFQNAIPSIAAMLMVLLYNLADTFFIGQTNDPMQVAAISLASQVFVIYSALGTVFGIGGTSVISRVLGAGNTSYAKKVSSFCMWGSVFIGLLFSIVVWVFMNPLLNLLGANYETWGFTKDYLWIVALSGPCVVINGCYSNVLRAEGQSTKAMLGQLIGNLTNIILDPIMISGFGWDTKGSAIATVIGNVVGTLYYICYFARGKSMLSISIKEFSLKNKIASRVFAIGIPAALSTVLMSVSHIILNKEMAGYGNLQLAGVGVATNIMKIPGLISMGLGQGIQPLVGYCSGSGDWRRCKKIIRFSLTFGLILSIAMCVLAYVFINPLVGAFLTDAAAFEYGVSFTKVMLGTSFLYGIFYVLTNVVQGFGEAKAALLINVSRQGIIYIPALFIMQALMGMDGLIWTQIVSDIISVVLAVILFMWTYNRVMNKSYESDRDNLVVSTNMSARTMPRTHYIITLGRSYGAGGRSVGKIVGKALNIPYYDKELVEQAAKESGLSGKYLENMDEKNLVGNMVDRAITLNSRIYEAQRQVILKLAKEGPCIIVGRCADCILHDEKNLFRVFITAPKESRVKRISQRDCIDEQKAAKKIDKVDKERAEYHDAVSDSSWGDAGTYDLMVDTEKLGIQGAADVILAAVQKLDSLKYE